MGYSIALCDPVTRKTINIEKPHQMRGGQYVVGGTTELWLYVTYNYSHYYYEAYKVSGLNEIHEKTGCESIKLLNHMIEIIKTNYPSLETSPDYWEDTPGNAIRPLYMLLAMAQMRPDGVWNVD